MLIIGTTIIVCEISLTHKIYIIELVISRSFFCKINLNIFLELLTVEKISFVSLSM